MKYQHQFIQKYFQYENTSFSQVTCETLSITRSVINPILLGKSIFYSFCLLGLTHGEVSINILWMTELLSQLIYITKVMRSNSCSFNWTYLFYGQQDTLIFISSQKPTDSSLYHLSYSLVTKESGQENTSSLILHNSSTNVNNVTFKYQE